MTTIFQKEEGRHKKDSLLKSTDMLLKFRLLSFPFLHLHINTHKYAYTYIMFSINKNVLNVYHKAMINS